VFYVYLWLREDGTPYYVGKSKPDRNNRAYSSLGHRVPCPKDISRIIVQDYDSEQEAFDAEIFFIAFFGRIDLGTGRLRNLTDGGEGTAGCACTEQRKQRIGLANKGRKPKGYARTEAHRHLLSTIHQGNKKAIGHGRPKGKQSPEEIARRGLAIQAWWDRRRGC
jgi:hypothetical protein